MAFAARYSAMTDYPWKGKPATVAAEPKTLENRIDRWLIARGVPRLADDSVQQRLPELAATLIVVAAAQAAGASAFSVETWQMALGPAIVTACALPLLPLLATMLDPSERVVEFKPLRIALRALALALAVVLAALLLPPRPGRSLSEFAVNLNVMLFALFAFGLLLRRDSWRSASPASGGYGSRTLAVAAGAAVVTFALEGIPVEPLDEPAFGVLPSSLPQALPALPVVGLMWFLAWRGPRASRGQSPTEGGAGSAAQLVLPAAVLLLGVETAILPSAASPWPAALAPLGVLAFLLVVSARRRCSEGDSSGRRHPFPMKEALASVIAVYLLGCPLLAAVMMQEDFFVALVINGAYIGVAAVGILFGLDRVALWAGQKLTEHWRDTFVGLLRMLPLFLVFTAFFILTSELWQAAHAMGQTKYVVLLGWLLTSTAVLLWISSRRELGRHSEFDSWLEVSRAARRIEGRPKRAAHTDAGKHGESKEAQLPTAKRPAARGLELDPVIEELLAEEHLSTDEDARQRSGKPELHLARTQRINLLALLSMYQALVFVPLVIGAFVVFQVVGRLAVPNQLLNNWIHGDSARPADYEDFLADPFLVQPWTLVALFLAVLSLLFFSTYTLRDKGLRNELFAGADEGVRQRLAVRILYSHRISRPREENRGDVTQGAPPSAAARSNVR
jgi:hypothetical protein